MNRNFNQAEYINSSEIENNSTKTFSTIINNDDIL